MIAIREARGARCLTDPRCAARAPVRRDAAAVGATPAVVHVGAEHGFAAVGEDPVAVGETCVACETTARGAASRRPIRDRRTRGAARAAVAHAVERGLAAVRRDRVAVAPSRIACEAARAGRARTLRMRSLRADGRVTCAAVIDVGQQRHAAVAASRFTGGTRCRARVARTNRTHTIRAARAAVRGRRRDVDFASVGGVVIAIFVARRGDAGALKRASSVGADRRRLRSGVAAIAASAAIGRRIERCLASVVERSVAVAEARRALRVALSVDARCRDVLTGRGAARAACAAMVDRIECGFASVRHVAVAVAEAWRTWRLTKPRGAHPHRVRPARAGTIARAAVVGIRGELYAAIAARDAATVAGRGVERVHRGAACDGERGDERGQRTEQRREIAS